MQGRSKGVKPRRISNSIDTQANDVARCCRGAISASGRCASRFRCPICKKPVDPPDEAIPKHAKFFPFCSERCRLIDLGAWLDADYRITSTPDEQDDEFPADDSTGPSNC